MTVAVVGTDWQVSTHPSATSSSVSALLVYMETAPSTSLAMQVAQLPASHENGAAIPICRAGLQDRGAGVVLDGPSGRRARS